MGGATSNPRPRLMKGRRFPLQALWGPEKRKNPPPGKGPGPPGNPGIIAPGPGGALFRAPLGSRKGNRTCPPGPPFLPTSCPKLLSRRHSEEVLWGGAPLAAAPGGRPPFCPPGVWGPGGPTGDAAAVWAPFSLPPLFQKRGRASQGREGSVHVPFKSPGPGAGLKALFGRDPARFVTPLRVNPRWGCMGFWGLKKGSLVTRPPCGNPLPRRGYVSEVHGGCWKKIPKWGSGANSFPAHLSKMGKNSP